jgi:hypothetical protein
MKKLRQSGEVKVQKKLILVRFFDVGIPDPKNMVTHIPYAKKQNWRHDKEIRIDSLELVDYVMKFVEASYQSPRTRAA